eukprot:GEMP01089154.1.p1 GENE.GEMP01089154.1~~GEMP01089154.1.p1  ORF type:complete len:293 (+),score=54.37 GEMP01089154.1:42-881(+)
MADGASQLGANISDILTNAGCEIKRCDKDRNVVGDAKPEEFGQQVEQAQRLSGVAKALEDYTPEQKIEWAKRVKDTANELYYKREIKEATGFYVDCLVALDLLDEKTKARMREEIQLPVTTNLAACMLEQGRNLRCAELCNIALEIDPNHEVARSRKAVAHFRLGDYDDAYDDFSKALELLDDPRSDKSKRMQSYMNQISRTRKAEKKRLRRTFDKLKVSELYAEKDDWKPAPPTVQEQMDDSDAAIAKLLEKYRPISWSAWAHSWATCPKACCKRKRD